MFEIFQNCDTFPEFHWIVPLASRFFVSSSVMSDSFLSNFAPWNFSFEWSSIHDMSQFIGLFPSSFDHGQVSPLAWIWSEPTRLFWSVVVIFPILLHLYGKMRKQVIDFPAARFLSEVHTSRIHAEHWRNLGLLALRCLLILLIVIAAAVPFSDKPIKKPSASSSFETPVCHLFVIDGSASMLAQNRSGESCFDLAIRKIREQISTSHEGDRFGVWVAAESSIGNDAAPTARLSEFQRRLDRLECTLSPADLQNLFDTLIHRLENPNFLRNQERCDLTILSDLDASTWEYPLESSESVLSTTGEMTPENVWKKSAQRLAELANVRLVAVGSPPSENIGVKNLRVETGDAKQTTEAGDQTIIDPNSDKANTAVRTWNIAADVWRKGGKNPREVPITLWINDHMAEQKSVTLAPNASSKIEFSGIQIPENILAETAHPPSENEPSQELSTPLANTTSEPALAGPMIRVRVTCESDRFPLDDTCETAVRYAQQLHILLVDTRTDSENISLDPGPLRWIVAAIAPLKAAGPVQIDIISWSKLPFTALNRFDDILIPDPPEFRPEILSILGRYVRLGGAVWIFMGPSWKTSEVLGETGGFGETEGTREPPVLSGMSPTTLSKSALSVSESSLSSLSDTVDAILPFPASPSTAMRSNLSTDLFSESSNRWFPVTVRGLQNTPTTVLLSGENDSTVSAPRPEGSQVIVTPPGKNTTIRKIETYNTEIFKNFTGRNEAEIPLLRYRLLVPHPDAKVLWRTADGDPLLVESRWGRGVTLVTAFGLTPSDTLFVVLPSFVPFVQEVLAYLRPRSVSDSTSIVPAMSEVSFRFRTADTVFLRMIREELGWKWQNDDSSAPPSFDTTNESPGTVIYGKFQAIRLSKWDVTATQWILLAAIGLWLITLFRKEE